MWYIINEDNEFIDIELGSTDIFNYMGKSIFLDEDGMLQEYIINDAFLTDYDWFDDLPDYDKINAYRKGTFGRWQYAIVNWESDYIGEYDSDEDFARSLYDDTPDHPLLQYVDWSRVASDIMHDHFEEDGFYFTALVWKKA